MARAVKTRDTFCFKRRLGNREEREESTEKYLRERVARSNRVTSAPIGQGPDPASVASYSNFTVGMHENLRWNLKRKETVLSSLSRRLLSEQFLPP